MTVVRKAEAQFILTRESLVTMPNKDFLELNIHDILLRKMKEQGFPYETLEEHATIEKWQSYEYFIWVAKATWKEIE